MTITLPYGDDHRELIVDDSDLVEVLRPNVVDPVPDDLAEIRRAVDAPIGTAPLAEIVSGGRSICIICDDLTRPTPVDRVLEVLLGQLEKEGVTPEQVIIVMALGSHRYMTIEEMRARVGSGVYDRYRVLNHEFRDKDKLMDLGLAPGGVRIWANRDVMSCDVRIGVGSILPHPAAGWSGGGKIIYPGVTGEDTVAQFHVRQGLEPTNMFGMDECPLRLEMEQWVESVGLDFVINLVLTSEGRVYRAVAGHYRHAQRAGVVHAKAVSGVRASGGSDICVVSSRPADSDLWQASKALVSADLVTREGGTMILLSPCPEGVGPHPDFMVQCGRDDAEQELRELRDRKSADSDPLALAVGAAVSRIRRRKRIVVVSDGLSAASAEEGGMGHYTDLQEAYDAVRRLHPGGATISIMTHGAEICPLVG